jgi:hypothetical protein
VLFYEMLGGRRPFRGRNNAGLIASILGETPAPLMELRPDRRLWPLRVLVPTD